MAKPYNPSKLIKGMSKGIKELNSGFNDPTDWISTGNYTLNYLLSADFDKGVPMGKVTCFAGASGSGKSYICSGNLVKAAQDKGYFVILVDSENALDEKWLQDVGVDTDPSRLVKFSDDEINKVTKLLANFFNEYKDTPEADRPKILFVIDSLGNLQSQAQIDQFAKGELKGDFGHKAKALKSMVIGSVNKIGNLNVGLVVTNHSYESQNMFDPDDKISGGQGFIYASSMVVAMGKNKLKEDEEGEKTKTVQGIKAVCKIMKTRYSKPFEEVKISIPYGTGMDPYSGLFEMLEDRDLAPRTGNSYIYTLLDGTELKYTKKKYKANADGVLDLVMKDIMARDSIIPASATTGERDEHVELSDDELRELEGEIAEFNEEGNNE
jgi:RecA/RadA recombinase